MLRTELDISSLKRMIDCRVSYYFRIPRGTYIDTDGLKVSLLNHCFLSTPFNTGGYYVIVGFKCFRTASKPSFVT